MNRRQFFRAAAVGVAGATVAGTCYGFFEAGWIRVAEQTLPLPRLPLAFQGTRIAFLTDIHHGPYTDISYVQNIVRTTNLLQPDLILLGGDYSLRDPKYIGPCFEMLAHLRAPMGVYGVLGNHDYWHGLKETREGFKSAKITELTNRSEWLQKNGERFCLAGVDDLWTGKPDSEAALGDLKPQHACLLLSHNPDFCETLRDPRVGLVLSGHTHGGQIDLPRFGRVVLGRKARQYAAGMYELPGTYLYVNKGVGFGWRLRYNVRPEVAVLTLKRLTR
jgi:hypothetical protein